MLYSSTIEVSRPGPGDDTGIATFVYTIIGTGKARVDLLHLHDPGLPVVVRESGSSPDRLGTVFLTPIEEFRSLQPEDVIRVIDGPYTGTVMKVDVHPTAAYLGGGRMLHLECKVREVHGAIA